MDDDAVPQPEDMTEAHREAIETRVKRAVRQFRVDAAGLAPRHCPLCGYYGRFTAYGRPPRFDARCAKCASLERHRLFALLIERRPEMFGREDTVLHFAPERLLKKAIQPRVKRYAGADVRKAWGATLELDIEAIDLPDGDVTRIVCNHVLEHVDDGKALAEMYRVLAPWGVLLLTTPVVEGWAETYENPEVTDPKDRTLHFGQSDHVRMYGRDLRDRIRAAGFELEEFTAVEPDVQTYGLLRGETIFVARKPAGGAS